VVFIYNKKKKSNYAAGTGLILHKDDIEASRRLIKVGQTQRPGLSLQDLPKCGAVQIEEFAEAALGVFNVAVYPFGGQVDKARGKFDQEHLKLQPFLQALFRVNALVVSPLQTLSRGIQSHAKIFYFQNKLLPGFTGFVHGRP